MSVFSNFVGQGPIKQRLEFYIDGYAKTEIFPNLILNSAKGCGKTAFARSIAKALNDKRQEKCNQFKYFVEINCASIKSGGEDIWVESFIESVKSPEHVTYFLDEIHALPVKICNWLLTVIDPDREEKTIKYGPHEAVFDFKKSTILAASTEKQKIFIPLLDRFTVVELQGYTNNELAQIIKGYVALDDDAAMLLADRGRGNARAAVNMAKEGLRYLSVIGEARLTLQSAERLVKILDVFPLGLSRAEVEILKHIGANSESSLTSLCAKTGLTRAAHQNSEGFLLRHSLIEVNKQSKRELTDVGLDYLRNIEQTPSVMKNILVMETL